MGLGSMWGLDVLLEKGKRPEKLSVRGEKRNSEMSLCDIPFFLKNNSGQQYIEAYAKNVFLISYK
jgi:hypothetical protein